MVDEKLVSLAYCCKLRILHDARYFVGQPAEHQNWMNRFKSQTWKWSQPISPVKNCNDQLTETKLQKLFGIGLHQTKWHTTIIRSVSGYVCRTILKEGDWKPTPPGPDKPMGGVYGGCRTFVYREMQKKTARKPLPYSTEKKFSVLRTGSYEVWTRNGSLWCLLKTNGLVEFGATIYWIRP